MRSRKILKKKSLKISLSSKTSSYRRGKIKKDHPGGDGYGLC
jgi:hypothetical protein